MIKNSFCLFVFVCLLFLPVCAHSVDWKVANKVTLSWSPVTTIDDGSPIPASDTITYELFTVPMGADKQTEKISQGKTKETSHIFTFLTEGFYFLGVRAERSRENDIVSSSPVSWTDNPVSMLNGLSQGVKFFFLPSTVKDLRFD